MEFKHLEVFTKLVDNLNFSVTAHELHISQPTVSLHIKQLETELDTPLFIRSTRELKITEAGRHLYENAKDILQHRNDVVEYFTHPNKKILRIGVSTIPSCYIVPKLLQGFNQKYPNVLIHIEEKNSLATIKRIAEHKVDVGIVGMKTSEENCTFSPIYKDEFIFITANTSYYQALQKTKPTLQRLVQEPLIMRESGSGVKHNTELILQDEHIDIEKLNIVASIDNIEVIKHLTAQGIGTAFMSKIAAEDMIVQGKILSFPLENIPHQYRHLYLVWNKKITKSKLLDYFLEHVLHAE
ncbi:MAG: selenium metabolism-associated LysR family transcriptional regulator [Treponema sp.]